MNDNIIQTIATISLASSLAFIIVTFVQMWRHRQPAVAELIIVDEADQYLAAAGNDERVQLEADLIVSACWEVTGE